MGVELHYYDDVPAWKVVAPDPDRFQDVAYKIDFRLFRAAKGPLIACWLRLYDIPDQPFFLHRILDLSDKRVGDYLDKTAAGDKLILLFESTGEQEGFYIELPLTGSGLGAMIEAGRAHAADLPDVDGRAALDAFLSVFDPALKKRGAVDGAWDDVEKALPSDPRPKRERRHARRQLEADIRTEDLLRDRRGERGLFRELFLRSQLLSGGDAGYFAYKWLGLVLVVLLGLVLLQLWRPLF